MSELECLFFNCLNCIFPGDFIGRVKVTYDVFTVLEGERFEMKCSATHEDKRPQLLWYFVDHSAERTNLTGLGDSGKGGINKSQLINYLLCCFTLHSVLLRCLIFCCAVLCSRYELIVAYTVCSKKKGLNACFNSLKRPRMREAL